MVPHTCISELLYHLFGHKLGADELVVIFSARLDESGTDGRSPYTVVGGAVATADQWDNLEAAWGRLLARSKISAYHWGEFHQRKGDFKEWGNLKRKRFVEAQEKIIDHNTLFRISAGLESAVHSDIKKRMRGIKGFAPESNYSLCLRCLMFIACEQLLKRDPDCRLTILVEDGPWASGAMKTYQRVAVMTGDWKPAKHAHRLAGFGSVPKGERLSLEAADYLVGEEHAWMVANRRIKKIARTQSILFDGPLLEQWYEAMIKEKEHRRTHHRKNLKEPDS